MTEAEETRHLANRILDRPNADPDDDLAMLSRELLRADEKIAALVLAIAAVAEVRKPPAETPDLPQDALAKEEADLEARLEALHVYIEDSPEFRSLNKFDQRILSDQRAAMTFYRYMLRARLYPLRGIK